MWFMLDADDIEEEDDFNPDIDVDAIDDMGEFRKAMVRYLC